MAAMTRKPSGRLYDLFVTSRSGQDSPALSPNEFRRLSSSFLPSTSVISRITGALQATATNALFDVTLFFILLYTMTRIFLSVVGFLIIRFCWDVIRFCAGQFFRRISKRSRLIYHVQANMKRAKSFESWATLAITLDEIQGHTAWRTKSDIKIADEVLITTAMRLLRQQMQAGDAQSMTYSLNSLVLRGYAGLDNPKLYNVCRVGTKALIEEYISTVKQSLEYLHFTKFGDFSSTDKLEFFERCQQIHGRTALCLSGGGTLCFCHAGIVSVLFKQNVLPTIVSGTSGGSTIAAFLAIMTDEELRSIIDDVTVFFQDQFFMQPMWTQLLRLVRYGSLLDLAEFEKNARFLYKQYTFLEAYKRSGRIVNIPVSVSKRGRPYPLLLNYLTSPNVLIWSAVTASCALPGLLPPVKLMAKDPRTGETIAYFPDGVEWIDGSIHMDIPAAQLSELFNVSQFIVAQVNPHVVPFVRPEDDESAATDADQLLGRLTNILLTDIRHRAQRLAKLRVIPRFLGQDLSTIFTQEYRALSRSEIVIIPTLTVCQQMKCLSILNRKEMREFMRAGELAAFPFLSQIRLRSEVELTLEKIINSLKSRRMRALTKPGSDGRSRGEDFSLSRRTTIG